MPLIMVDLLKQKAEGSEADLFNIADQFFISLNAARITTLHGTNSLVNAALRASGMLLRTNTMAMPDIHTRDANDVAFHKLRTDQQEICHKKFTSVITYIETFFTLPADALTQKNAAGFAHYPHSATNYDECTAMMSSLDTYLSVAVNVTNLESGGMVATFVADCTTATSDLANSNTSYITQVNISRTMTNEKTVQKNLLYDRLTFLTKVSDDAYADDIVQRHLFNYTVRLDILHPPHPEIQTFKVKLASHKDIHNAVLYQDITNEGTENSYMYNLDKPIIPANQITIAPNQTIQNTYSINLRFDNPSTLTESSIKTTRTVRGKD